MLVSHTELRLPASRKRTKPAGADLAIAVTDLGPNSTTHLESSRRSTYNTVWNKHWKTGVETLRSARFQQSNYVVQAGLPNLTALQIYQVSANKSAAINKALEKLKDQKINLAVSLAELPETIGMFISAAKVITKLYRDCAKKEQALLKLMRDSQRQSAGGKKSRRKRRETKDDKKRDYLAEVASLWLGFRYGIMPLVYDLQGALDELARVKTAKHDLIQIKTSNKWEDSWTKPHPHNSSDFQGEPEEYEYRATCYVCINARITDPRTAMQLGFTNGLQVLWEVTPLSFVIDWVLNIGETLATFDATQGTVFVSGTISEKRERRRVIKSGFNNQDRYQGNPPEYHTLVETEVEHAESFDKTYKREVLSSFPSPQFYVSNNMNKQRWFDAFALLKTILFSKR